MLKLDEIKEAAKDTVFKLRSGVKKLFFRFTAGVVTASLGTVLVVSGFQHNDYIMLGIGIGLTIAGGVVTYMAGESVDKAIFDATKDAFVA